MNSLYSLEKMDSLSWSMWLDLQCNVGNWPTIRISFISNWLFPNSLTGTTFTWYATLPRNSIMSWREIERQLHTQFFRVEPKISIEEFTLVHTETKLDYH